MNKRLIRCALIVLVIPALTMMVCYGADSAHALWFALTVGAALQIIAVLLCKRHMLKWICPTDGTIKKSGVKPVPAPYEPGRYRKDAVVAEYLTWLGLLAPALLALARAMPEEVSVSVLNGVAYTAPNITLLVLSLFLLIMGPAMLCFWAFLTQAMMIYNEPSDRRRYLLMGYAELIGASQPRTSKKPDLEQYYDTPTA